MNGGLRMKTTCGNNGVTNAELNEVMPDLRVRDGCLAAPQIWCRLISHGGILRNRGDLS
jgi:hypothetical protein